VYVPYEYYHGIEMLLENEARKIEVLQKGYHEDAVESSPVVQRLREKLHRLQTYVRRQELEYQEKRQKQRRER
jgi:hypothetical protein